MRTKDELQYANLTCLVHGFELTSYQKGLAKQEFDKLIKSIKQTEVSEDLINDIALKKYPLIWEVDEQGNLFDPVDFMRDCFIECVYEGQSMRDGRQ